MKSAVWLLAGAVMACSAVAAYWLEQNKSLRFKVRQLERQLTALELAQTPAVLIPQASCHNNEPPVAPTYFDDAALAAMCASYVNERASDIGVQSVMGAEQGHRIVLKKYQFLLQALTLAPEDAEALVELFGRREALLNAPVQDYYASQAQIEALIVEQQDALVMLDAQVYELLAPQDREKYALLKDSDFAQYQLAQLEQGLEGHNALTAEQKSELLLSKLGHQRDFEKAVAGLIAPAGTEAEAGGNSSRQALSAALEAYKGAYFSDSAAFLGEEQFARLKAFENAQFEDLFESLRQQIPTLRSED